MALNSEVLPAPFGPMTAVIDPFATSRSTAFTAVSPRNRRVSLSTWRSAGPGAPTPAAGGASLSSGAIRLFLAVELRLDPRRRPQPLRPQAHHEDERKPENQPAPVGEA